jgi:hypothetical protein
MKNVYFEDLKTLTEKEPLYSVLSRIPQNNGDPRAIGCCPLACLNLLMLCKKRMGKDLEQTAHDILTNEIMPLIDEKDDLSVPFQSAMGFFDKSPIFNGWRTLVLNPNGMNQEIFWAIALRRLLNGDIVLCMLEVPTEEGSEAKKKANHLSVLHSDGTDVFYDGLKMSVETLSNILWFSPVNTLMFFSPPVEEKPNE